MAKILILDDDFALRETLCSLLQEAGHRVVQAADGMEGLLRFEENPSDVVITDIRMPRKTGHEAILELRQNHPGLVIIAMTGGGPVDKELYCRVAEKLGANQTLTKPFAPEELLSAVHSLL